MKRIAEIVLGILITIHTMPSFALAANEVYQKVHQSIYAIIHFNAVKREYNVIGSSVAISPHLLATNCHVALASPQLGIKIGDNIKLGQVVYQNRRRDLCLITVPKAHFTAIALRPSHSLKIGEEVFAIGSPHGLERTLSKGIISNIHQRGQGPFNEGPIIQTDAAISPGSSGGGIFDSNANLVGISTFIFRPGMAENLGFAIPAKWIATALNHSKRKNQLVEKPRLNRKPLISNDNIKQQQFGTDKITVIYNPKHCFIYIPGRDPHGKKLGGIIWDLRYPQALFPFFTTISGKQALQHLSAIKALGKRGQTLGYLYIKRHTQAIISYQTNTRKNLNIVKFNSHLTNILSQSPTFFIQLPRHHAYHGYVGIEYGTQGLKQAVTFCKKRDEA